MALACSADDTHDDAATSLAPSTETAASTTEASGDAPDSSTADDASVSETGTDSATTDGAAEQDSTGIVHDVPEGVFLWTGSGGGGPGTDLHPDAVEQVLVDAGIEVGRGDVLPDDFADRFGTLVYLNPREEFDLAVDSFAEQLVSAGGRLVLVMEHCKNGCWGNAAGHNALLEQLGSTLRMHGDGGAPLADTVLSIEPVVPLTDEVGELVVYYSGRVEVGTATALGTIPNGDVVIGWEALGPGEVLAIADSSMFGYRLQAADNRQFVRNLAKH